MTRSTSLWILAAIAVALSGCGMTPPATVLPAPPSGPTDQLSEGAGVYREHCSGCHGDAGHGTEGRPPLVGATALPETPPAGRARKTPIRTARDLFTFAKSEMPPVNPGGLSDDDYWAVVAYLLKENGASIAGKTIGSAGADAIRVHH